MCSAASFPSTEILGVRIACLDQAGLIAQALAWSQAQDVRTIHYANAHCLNLASQDAAYRDLLNGADLVYADGVSLAWSSRLLGGCRLCKLTGADWIEPLCAEAARRGVRLYLLGGRPGIARAAADALLNRHAALTIVGAADGYFQDRSAAEVVREIQSVRAQLVLVGLGVPRQEHWIASQRQGLGGGVWWGVGALFDFIAGAEPRAPRRLNRLGLEWLWRLAHDPVGKWRRYVLGNPAFILRVIAQYLRQL